MTCVICRTGTTSFGMATVTLQRDNSVVIIIEYSSRIVKDFHLGVALHGLLRQCIDLVRDLLIEVVLAAVRANLRWDILNSGSKGNNAESYRHPEADSPLRPEAGTQAQFRKKKPPATYRYDSSLSPALDWDGQNGVRDLADWLIGCIRDAAKLEPPHTFKKPRELILNDGTIKTTVRDLQDAVDQLAALGKPFLNWAGKAERLSFDVPTLPLFVHERLSTAGIIETLRGHRKPVEVQFDLFGDPRHSIADQILRAYEYRDKWVNRMVLGDSLVVMNSLLHYEGLGGQVQTIYMDPPYGVKFGSNFQPFVRKRDVKHNETMI